MMIALMVTTVNLSTKERLDLFIKVCQAIQHAHLKGNNLERLLTLAAPVGRLRPVQFSPDGNVVVGQDPYVTGSLHLWCAPSSAEIEQAEAKDKAEGKQP